MKKATIWFLTIIMALTFCGLLYLQIMYMKNIIRMRDDQFSEGVRRSLYSVSTTLEQDETRHFLEEDAAAIEQSIYSQLDASLPGKDALKYSFPKADNLDVKLHAVKRCDITKCFFAGFYMNAGTGKGRRIFFCKSSKCTLFHNL